MHHFELFTPHLLSSLTIHVHPSALPAQGVGLPPALHHLFQKHLQEVTALVTRGAIFDGPVLAVRGIQHEGKNLLLEVQSSTYAPLSAARKAYLEAMDIGLLCTSRRADVPALLGGSLCAATIVLTADQRILTTQRSARVSRARSFSLALGEVLEPKDVQEGGDFVRGVCARTLEQELGLTLTPEQRASCLKPLHLLVTHDTGEWVFLVVADFRGEGAAFSAARILQNASLAVDAWETENRSSEAYSEASLRAFLAAHAGHLAFWADGLVELLLEELPP